MNEDYITNKIIEMIEEDVENEWRCEDYYKTITMVFSRPKSEQIKEYYKVESKITSWYN